VAERGTATRANKLPNVWTSRPVRVTVVAMLILTVVGVGVAVVLPRHTAWWLLHYTLTAWLIFNIAFNYLATLIRDPGTVTANRQPAQSVQTGSLDCYTFCGRCNAAKPPTAHHCSKCAKCIEGLDHHCVFIGSCVGAGNRRAFVVFVYWTVIGCVYVYLLSAMLLWQRRAEVADAWTQFWQLFTLKRAFLVMWWDFHVSPPWLMAVQYLLSVSIGVISAGTYLLVHQLKSLLLGVTYVEALKMQAGGTLMQRQPPMQRLRAVFGDGAPVTWLLPAWDTPRRAPHRPKMY